MKAVVRRAESASIAIRRSAWLRDMGPLWRIVRPVYTRALRLLGARGLVRVINGTDPILIPPQLYTLSDVYEPAAWNMMMQEVRPGDVVADVGAHYGLYTAALAQRVGPRGRLVAFEPDRSTAAVLRQTVVLNGVGDWTRVMECAVGDGTRSVGFHGGKSMESHVVEDASEDQVQLVTLDSVFGDERLDILKVDVEGYEARVLRGAANLLQDKERGPRAIFIEVHPPFWAAFGTQGAEIIEYLRSNDYDVRDLRGQTVLEIRDYGEIVARRCHDHHAGTAQ